jgi:kinetochore protein Mis12/MTW1
MLLLTCVLLWQSLKNPPQTLLDDIINTVNEVVTRAVDAAEAGLLSTDPANLGFDKRAEEERRVAEKDENGAPSYPEAKSEIEEGLHKLETLLESNVDRNFDKFEIYVLRGVLHVPDELVPWVRLGHYEGIQLPTMGGEPTATAEDVQRSQHRLRQTRKLNSVLEVTVKRNKAALEQLTALTEASHSNLKIEQDATGQQENAPGKGTYAFLTNGESAKALGMNSTITNNEEGPLAINTSFALSQLPALRSLLDELRPKLADIGNAEAAASESHTARERRIYLHDQTRKAVERQGVEIGAFPQGSGRRIAADELSALESIADSLSAGNKVEDGDQMEE